MNSSRTRDLGAHTAFPLPDACHINPGLTKREWMATTILAGQMVNGEYPEAAVENAVWLADRLLEALQYPADPPRI